MKKNPRSSRQLTLTTMTLRRLTQSQLRAVGGGDTNDGDANTTSKYTRLGC